MKILVYGAGVLGSLYAAKLHEAGQDVSILARGQRLAELLEHGIVLEEGETGRRTVGRVRVVESLGPDDTYDLVVVVMRKNQVAAILPVLAANRHTPNVLFMVNNAEGPREFVAALGRNRVLLGFPGAGGGREGHVVRYHVVHNGTQPTTFGELDGTLSPRLKQIVATFRVAGFPTAVSRNMDAWLKTHVAVVSPIANALYYAGGDNYRLAGMPEGVLLLVRAIKEGFAVLRRLGVSLTPVKFKLVASLPDPVLAAVLRRMLATSWAEVVMARHANAARDEMKQLADEFQVLCRRSGVATPAIDRLYTCI